MPGRPRRIRDPITIIAGKIPIIITPTESSVGKSSRPGSRSLPRTPSAANRQSAQSPIRAQLSQFGGIDPSAIFSTGQLMPQTGRQNANSPYAAAVLSGG